jgi:hypothetical protein
MIREENCLRKLAPELFSMTKQGAKINSLQVQYTGTWSVWIIIPGEGVHRRSLKTLECIQKDE